MTISTSNREILRLAIPSIVSNITVPLLGLVDLTIVGHMASELYIGAISVGSMIFNVIYWLMGFLRMGTSGMTSQALGRGDHAAVLQLLRHSLCVALGIGLGMLLMQWPLRWLALWLMGPSPAIAELVATFFHIVVWGAPAMLGLYAVNGWMVGMQNTRVPMVVAIVQNVANIIISLVLVFGLGMQIEGVALGTLAAQWTGFGLALWMAWQKARPIVAEIKEQAIRAAEAHTDQPTSKTSPLSTSDFFTVNRDIFFRTLCLVAVNLFFTSAGARQGDMMLAVNTLLMTFYLLFSYIMDGFAFAAEAIAGRLYGARQYEALRATNALVFRWGWGMVALFTLAYALGGDGMLSLITDKQEVVAAARPYFFWACLVPLAGMAAFVYDGIFIGLTATRGMLMSSLTATLVFFALFAAARQALPVNHALWLAFIAYIAMRGIMQWWLLRKKLYTHQN